MDTELNPDEIYCLYYNALLIKTNNAPRCFIIPSEAPNLIEQGLIEIAPYRRPRTNFTIAGLSFLKLLSELNDAREIIKQYSDQIEKLSPSFMLRTKDHRR